MFDPREVPAFWGLCGGLILGAHGPVTAYSAKAGTPDAGLKAWLRLGFGLIAGPVVAEPPTEHLILQIITVLGSSVGLRPIAVFRLRSQIPDFTRGPNER